jgi:hypothetical protein
MMEILRLYIFLELETLWQLNLSKYLLEDSRVASWSKHKTYIKWFELCTSVESAGVALLECPIKSIAYSTLTFEEILEFEIYKKRDIGIFCPHLLMSRGHMRSKKFQRHFH